MKESNQPKSAANLYDSLFNGKSAPLPSHLQAELNGMKDITKSMTEEEKIKAFDKLMGR